LKKTAPFSQAISGRQERLEQARGIQCAIASSTGSQNHSYKDGYTTAFAHE